MFAIIKTGGRQYRVEKGSTLDINRIEAKEGDTVNMEKVLLISDKTATKVGTPLVEGAYAIAKVVAHKRGDKIVVYKMKAKKRYQKTQGHRQELTTIEITDLKASGGSKTAAKKEEPKAELKAEPKVAKEPKKEESE